MHLARINTQKQLYKTYSKRTLKNIFFSLAVFKIVCMSELPLKAAKWKPRYQFSPPIQGDFYALPT